MIDLTPSMTTVLATIGTRSITASEVGVNGGSLKRLWELGFLKMDLPPEGRLPPFYSLTERGEGAAAILNAAPHPVERTGPVGRIKQEVAQFYGLPPEEMESDRRTRKVARPRQVAMYITKKLTPKSYPNIGRQFGNRDHTTVIHAVRTVERLMSENHDFKDEVKTLIKAIVSTERAVSVDKPQIAAFVTESTGA